MTSDDFDQEYRDRFYAKTMKVDSGCIEWQGATNRRPSRGIAYGQLKLPKQRGLITAHRLAYILRNGQIPDGMFVCHKCDNPLCVNPDHLFSGTPKNNSDDMISKGRQVIPSRRGVKNGRAVLTPETVSAIRADRADMSLMALANKYGVSKSQIHRIVAGHLWS